MSLDARLRKGLTITANELVAVCEDHWSGWQNIDPCKRCGLVLCPSYRVAWPLAHKRRAEATVEVPEWLRHSNRRPSLPSTARDKSRTHDEELFDHRPYVDHSRRMTPRRRAAT